MSNERNLWLADVCNQLAQRLDICVDRSCNHVGLSEPRGIPRNHPIVVGEMVKLERPTFGTAKQAMQKNDGLSVAARTERHLTIGLLGELQRRANWHKGGSTVGLQRISRQCRITFLCFPHLTKMHLVISRSNIKKGIMRYDFHMRWRPRLVISPMPASADRVSIQDDDETRFRFARFTSVPPALAAAKSMPFWKANCAPSSDG